MTIRELEKIIYYESYVVIDPGNAPLKAKELLSIERYFQLKQEFKEGFKAKMGAEALKNLIAKLDLGKMAGELRLTMKNATSIQKKLKCAKQLKVVEAFRHSGNEPEWMKYFKDGKPNSEWLKKLNAVREILMSDGRTLVQGSLSWIWARSERTIPIPGFKTVQQVEENDAAMQFGPLNAEQMREIDALLGR